MDCNGLFDAGRGGLFGFGMWLVFGCSYGFRLCLCGFGGWLLVISIQVCVRFLFILVVASSAGFMNLVVWCGFMFVLCIVVCDVVLLVL